MSDRITIALDAMGGDTGPDVVLPAALKALDRCPRLHVILVGPEEMLTATLKKHAMGLNGRMTMHPASEIVTMEESPVLALRRKKDSSMRVSIDLVNEGQADACVSAGNTGALMAISRFVLKMLPGIDRPAIISHLPSANGHTYMLDLGANVDSSAGHLRDFAIMGSELARAIGNIEAPSVALLNVGEEDIKGNEQVREAAQLLAETDLNYVGFAEGDDIFLGDFDVIVCDGFVGNIALKSSEGVVKLVTATLKEAFGQSIFTRTAAFFALPILTSFKKTFDPGRYNGASLLGLKGIVIKSHGGADAPAFANAIDIAIREVEKQVPQAISSRLERVLSKAR